MKAKAKSLLAVVAAVLALVLGVVLFAACDNGGVEGTYKFSSMTVEMDGETKEIKVGESYDGMTVSADYMVLEIKSDGTISMTMGGETYTSTWKAVEGKENTIEISAVDSPETKTITVENGTIKFEVEPGKAVTLKK